MFFVEKGNKGIWELVRYVSLVKVPALGEWLDEED